MASYALPNSVNFKVKEVAIVTKFGTILDISVIFTEINIYDSLLSPVMSGHIVVRDSVGISTLLKKRHFDGAEAILIHIEKNEDSQFSNFKKAFRIYKQSKRIDKGLNSEEYVLYFISDEYIFSEQRKVSQAYEGTYSDIGIKILKTHVKPPNSKLNGIYEDSVGLRKVVIPSMRPLDAIEWCARRATDTEKSPNFMFYENMSGFNFARLSTLLTLPPVLEIDIMLKNKSEMTPEDEMKGARSYEILSYSDYFERIRSGVYAGRYMGFDPITRTYFNRNITYDDHYYSMKHGNKYPNKTVIDNRDKILNIEEFDSRKSMYEYKTAQKESAYIKRHDPTSIPKLENYEDWLFQRRALLNNLLYKRAKFTLPGNFQLTSGLNIKAYIPDFNMKDKDDDNFDESLLGKYLIVGARHIIGFDKHETVIEVASSSNEIEEQKFHPLQTQKLMSYGESLSTGSSGSNNGAANT